MEASFCLFWPRSKPASPGRAAPTSRPYCSSIRGDARDARGLGPPARPRSATRPGLTRPGSPARRARSSVTKRRRDAEVRAQPEGAPAEPLTTRPLGSGGARPPPFAPPPLPSPRRPGPQRRGRSRAAKRPGRAGSRRKDARALGGGEVIKGKEPAAGGSGRFGCSRRCCLVRAPLEGRSLDGPPVQAAVTGPLAPRPPPPSRSSVCSRPPRPAGPTWRRRCRST